MDYLFHITFTDGSNPFLSFPADKQTHKAALSKWKRNYTLTLIKRTETAGIVTEWYTAAEKRPDGRQDPGSESGRVYE